MNFIFEGIIEGIKMILNMDREVMEVILLSVSVSFLSTVISAVVGIPIGLYTLYKDFRFKKQYIRLINTMMAFPPVVIGLITALLISRKGPLGSFELMFTPSAMVIAQTILVTPIVIGIILNNSKEKAEKTIKTCRSLGANNYHTLIRLIHELRRTIVGAIVGGFGRAVSEVGAIMLVGGNIKGFTRTMTTFIAMNNSMGNYSTSIAMGIVLLLLAFLTNSLIYRLVE